MHSKRWIFITLLVLLIPSPVLAGGDGASLTLPDGFEAELLYSVPLEKQGSWINFTFDDQGHIIASAEEGDLYRVIPDEPDRGEVRVNPLRIFVHNPVRGIRSKHPLGGAQGLCWAFDSLYVVVNDRSGPHALGNGLYRSRDRDGDGTLDRARLLKKFPHGGGHGPHAVIPGPENRSLYVLGGNHTGVPDFAFSRQPRNWKEDLLLPRIWDPNGHARDIKAPGGWIFRTDPDGQYWDLYASGFRNPYDIDFNHRGDLFTYDADMEWDVGLPWYRPTRVLHVTSGSEFGWRSGSGKWPTYYPDSLPAVADVGRGSPTGMIFGYNTNFPASYQHRLFIADWSFGRVFTVQLEPDGASYTGTVEPFLQGAPFPVVDLQVGPDGALYMITGGRQTKTWLYRVRYTGSESTETVAPPDPGEDVKTASDLRHRLEKLHRKKPSGAVNEIWPHLNHDDRFIRYAARIALENQPLHRWRKRALKASDPQTLITALLALTRRGDDALQPRIVRALGRLSWTDVSERQKLSLLRVYMLCFTRMGEPSDDVRETVINRLNPHYPAPSYELNRELSRILVYLNAPKVIPRTLTLMEDSSTQQQQTHYAYVLRTLENGWSLEQRRRYFTWFRRARTFHGGASFRKYLRRIKLDAVGTLKNEWMSEEHLGALLEYKPPKPPKPGPREETIKNWTIDDLLSTIEDGLVNRNYTRGKKMFKEALCFHCHRFDGKGGSSGPDLTTVGRRFSNRYILESIIQPNRVVSDQYRFTRIEKKDGSVVVGRIVNMSGKKLKVQPSPLRPSALRTVNVDNVKSRKPVPVSPMPGGLLNSLKKEEILDLLAYLKSGGDPDYEMFQPENGSGSTK